MTATETLACTIRDMPARPAAIALEASAPELLGTALGAAFEEVAAALARQGLMPAGPPFARYLFHSPERVEFEAGFPIGAAFLDEERVHRVELPAATVAVGWHIGPYDGLGQTYARLEAWITAQGRHPAGPPIETYWSDPEREPDPSTWRTEIDWPVG
jgi:effector-binding domain-containing protein